MRIPLILAISLASLATAQDDNTEPKVIGDYDCSVTQALDTAVLTLTCSVQTGDDVTDYDYEITEVTRYEAYSGDHWLKLTVKSNRALPAIMLEYEYFAPGEAHGLIENSVYDRDLQDLRAGERVNLTEIPDIDTWDRVRISSIDGFECKGCGTYSRTELSLTTSIDMSSINPQDLGVVIQEVQARTLRQ